MAMNQPQPSPQDPDGDGDNDAAGGAADPDQDGTGTGGGADDSGATQDQGQDPGDDADDADDAQGGGQSDPSGNGADVRPRLIPGSDSDSGDIPASPQEEQDLQQTVAKALMMIHGRKSRGPILALLHDPTATVSQAVGRAAFNILSTISGQKKAVTSQPLDDDTLHEALGYVVPELMLVGCTAGLFPFEAPPDDSQTEPGQGNTEYDRQCRLACIEATKLYGESILKSPQGPQRTEQAQNDWAAGIQKDAQSGNLDPRLKQQLSSMQSQGQLAGGAPNTPTQATGAPAPAAAAAGGQQ
ncbi:MAG: hypothetical protein ACRDRL_11535 [Sciscionella sp.]